MTIVLSLLLTICMVLSPGHWLKKTMELTSMELSYKIFLVGLGVFYLGVAWVFQKYGALPIAKALGNLRIAVTGNKKRRKEYKHILEELWASS